MRQEQLNVRKQKEVFEEKTRKEREKLKSLLAVKATSLGEMTEKLEAAAELEAQEATLQQELANSDTTYSSTRAPERWERWDCVPSQFEILAATFG